MTYEGAVHYVISKGVDGANIFYGNGNKMALIDLLKEYSAKFKIPIAAYCIMDNCYHLILRNSNGKMSYFLRQLNAQYGMYYRKQVGSSGNVFYDRYKSVIIEGDFYLKAAIAFVLQEPVRDGSVDVFDEYIWSSASEHFSRKSKLVEQAMVKDLFETKKQFRRFVRGEIKEELPIVRTKYGFALGEDFYIQEAIKKYKEFAQKEKKVKLNKGDLEKTDTTEFESIDKVIADFESINGIKIDELDLRRLKHKRLRSQLLVHLKDRTMMTYKEILEIPLFQELKLSSLGRLYKTARERERS